MYKSGVVNRWISIPITFPSVGVEHIRGAVPVDRLAILTLGKSNATIHRHCPIWLTITRRVAVRHTCKQWCFVVLYISCISWSFILENIQIGIPQLARLGEMWGVCYRLTLSWLCLVAAEVWAILFSISPSYIDYRTLYLMTGVQRSELDCFILLII